MKEKEEGRPSGLRRVVGDDQLRREDDPAPAEAQSLETLRNGYSWVRALSSRYPGWNPHPVEGFPFTLPSAELSASRACMISLAGVYRKGHKPFNISPGVVPPKLRAMRLGTAAIGRSARFQQIRIPVNLRSRTLTTTTRRPTRTSTACSRSHDC